MPMPPKGSATRDSAVTITVSQFVYRAVSLQDTTIDEGTRFKQCYKGQQLRPDADLSQWPESRTYAQWHRSMESWRESNPAHPLNDAETEEPDGTGSV